MNDNLPVKIIIVFNDGDLYTIDSIQYFHRDITSCPNKEIFRATFESIELFPVDTSESGKE